MQPNLFRHLALALKRSVSVVAIASVAAASAYANPQGGTVAQGSATISSNPGNMLINQTSNRAIINWQGFSIGAGERTTFVQPGSSSAVLNRVTGGDLSSIYGTLSANGRVYLVNPNGIVVGASGVVDTAGFVGSTLDVSDANFMGGGSLLFRGTSTAGVVNLGKISASGGDIVLMARDVRNQGELSAPGGYVGLAGGNEILLTEQDTGSGRIFVKGGQGSVNNSGVVAATVAELKAAGGNQYALAINNTGIVRATGAVRDAKGNVYLSAGSGKISSSGKLEAKNGNGSGGTVKVSSVDAVDLSGAVDASGDAGKGGLITVEAKEINLKNATIDVSGAAGGGIALIGGGLRGKDASISNATSVTVDKETMIKADATVSGPAGTIVVWSDDTTQFAGHISAASAAGKGGFAEVSGKHSLNIAGLSIDAKGATANGTLLLDPDDITITANTATGANKVLDSDIQSILAGGTDVQILTGGAGGSTGVGGYTNGGGGAGDITIEAGARIIWTNVVGAGHDPNATLVLSAAHDINARDDVIIQNFGSRDDITTNEGGVVLLAQNDINIGSAAARTGGVAIGSEYGKTLVVAGYKDGGLAYGSNTVLDATTIQNTGSVNVTGGDVNGAYAQLGFIMASTRGTSDNEANGTITVRAGKDVNVQGGGNSAADPTKAASDATFAQIGHGGALFAGSPFTYGTGQTIGQVAAIIGDIEVQAGYVHGNVVVKGGTGSTAGDYAQIGHGAYMYNGADSSVTLSHGNISGNILVAARNSDVLLNAAFTPSQDGTPDVAIAQIGSGGHLTYVGAGGVGVEVAHGLIQGNIQVVAGGNGSPLAADGNVVLGTSAAPAAADDRFSIISNIGHQSYETLVYRELTASAGSLDATHAGIHSFDTGLNPNAAQSFGTAITVDAGSVTVQALDVALNSAARESDLRDNFQRSQIGHGFYTDASAATTHQQDNGLDNVPVNITEGNIAGDITVRDRTQDGNGITLDSEVNVGLNAITNDVMIARIGHASTSFVQSPDGDTDSTTRHGGNISITQANILGANIVLDTTATASDGVTVRTKIAAGLGAAEDNTAVAQIGHGGDIFAKSGNGGAAGGQLAADQFSQNGGDVTIAKGTVWDGAVDAGNGVIYGGTTDISVASADQVIVDSDTMAGLAAANRNNAESTIGHGFKLRVGTGDGGSGTVNLAAAGGRGGDLLITQQTPDRDYGGVTDKAYGLRGNIAITANHTADAAGALSLTADDTAATAGTSHNTALAIVGHGDLIEATSGHGGDGGSYSNANKQNIAPAQIESFGGRGGHINIDLANELIEGDTTVTVTGEVEALATATNAVAPSERAIVETVIGHGQRIAAHAGNGGAGGAYDFLANGTPVASGAASQDPFLVGFQARAADSAPLGQSDPNAGAGAARGGNGGDVNIAFGTITDRRSNGSGGFIHDGNSDVTLTITGNNTAPQNLSLIAKIAAGVAEGTGDDIYAGAGHHNRLYGEGGIGGNGGSTRTEFDNGIQPDASGGRGGDVRVASGNILGDITATMPGQALIESIAGHGTFTKVIATLGNTTDVVAVSQKGGNGGNLREDVASGCDPLAPACADGGIKDTSVANVTLIDRNGDDKFDVGDGIALNGGTVPETLSSAQAKIAGSTLADLNGDGINDAVVSQAGEVLFVAFNTGIGQSNHDNQYISVVDVDRNGVYDKLDGRAADNNAVAWGRLDYTVVTGRQPDTVNNREGGWSLQRGIQTQTALSTLPVDARRDHGTVITENGNALLGDFSMSNGGRGGDAITSVGYTVGNISINTGNSTLGDPDSLIVRSTVEDDFAATGGPRDIGIARLGHGAFQMSDTGASYANRAAGRVEIYENLGGVGRGVGTAGNTAANGGNAGNFAINASGGRGGNAVVVQGALRALDAANSELDHLAGSISVNPRGINNTDPSANAQRITVSAKADNDAGNNLSIAMIGHGSEAAAASGSWTGNNGVLVGAGEGNHGGNGASLGSATSPTDTTSQTEVANGGRGGDALVTQRQIKGDILVRTGADAVSGNDFSLQILAEKGPQVPAGASDNVVLSHVGHGRIAQATGGKGGNGDDGQYMANGGRGGDASIDQDRIIDSRITISLLEAASGNQTGLFGNGVLIDSSVKLGSNNIVRGQIGHGDLGFVEGGNGGNGADDSDVIEQLNQTANGARGGDAIYNQASYTYDIVVDAGPNLSAPNANALEILAHVDTVNVGTENHVLASIGHGGYGYAIGGTGGNGGNRNAVNPITAGDDVSLRDGDRTDTTSTIIDEANLVRLGTDRNGGRGGDATIVLGAIGYDTGDRGTYGETDRNGADITVRLHDDINTNAAAGDGALIQSKAGQGDGFTREVDGTQSVLGHTGFARVIAGNGGNAIQSTLGGLISEGDGGDGGDANAASQNIIGNIALTNDLDGGLSNSASNKDTNITIETLDQLPTDGTLHVAEARIGDLVKLESKGGTGGKAANPVPADAFPATITARGGDGGDATTINGQAFGNITVTAENSVKLLADAAIPGSPTLISAIGHRLEGEARAGNGGLSGLSDLGNQNLYFIYEALREYEANGRNLGALSEFEQKLIAPIVADYFEGKSQNNFLTKLLRVAQTTGQNPSFTGANRRDNNFVTNTNFTIPALTQEEQDTLLALMAASGDGGQALVIQQSAVTVNNTSEQRSVNGDITVNALARDTSDAARGIIVHAQDAGPGSGFQVAHIGHEAGVVAAIGGDAGLVRDYSNGMGGDGGSAGALQGAFDGRISLNSNHKITVEALDVASGSARQGAWIGHRQTVGNDRAVGGYRDAFIVKGGAGGSEEGVNSAGYNGNGGDVAILQDALVSNGTDANLEIALNALSPADDGESILIKSLTVNGGELAEAHIGHEMMISSAAGGNAGQRHDLHSHAGLDIGIREGNGGDVFIQQASLGADIDIVGRDKVTIKADTTTSGAEDALVMIGHDRTIGEASETDRDHNAQGGDSTGLIRAGFGGDSEIEDYNDTASINTNALYAVEDADAGVIRISHGMLSGSRRVGEDAQVIKITSRENDVSLKATTGLNGEARVEVGLSQHVHALTQEASLPRGVPQVRTAGEGGDIQISRGAITDEILIQALNRSNTSGKAVEVASTTGVAGTAEVLVGHETEFLVSTSTGTHGADNQSSGFGEARFAKLDGDLTAFIALQPAGTGTAGEATLRDANGALQSLHNVVAVLTMANKNAAEYSPADRTALANALANAQAALTAAEAAMNALAAGTTSQTAAVTAVQAASFNARAALEAANTTVTGAGIGAGSQLADHADGGSIAYTAQNVFGSPVANEGTVSGNVAIISGRDTNNDGVADTFDKGAVVVTSTTGAGGTAQTELGHRRTMANTTGEGGGDTNGGPDEGGVAGNGGSITVANITAGDVTLTADEVVVHATGGGGLSEIHLLHDVSTANTAGRSDIETLLGFGGNITASETVSGNAAINANAVSSARGARDSVILADGVADSRIQLGHQVDDTNTSDSDPTIGGTGSQDHNQGGVITAAQATTGNVAINLDLDGNGSRSDLTIRGAGPGPTNIRMGHSTAQSAISGNPVDDGRNVTASQSTTGDFDISAVEDMLIESAGPGADNIYVGHTASNTAQSGMVHGALGDRFGGVVTATQTVGGNITLDPARSYVQQTLAPSTGEVHVGHEGTQTAKSADDGAAPVNGTINAVDVNATQRIYGQLGVTTGEIIIQSQNANRVQLGHEAFHIGTTDGAGKVVASSVIDAPDVNGNADDLILTTLAVVPAEQDTKVTPSTGVNGDITIRSITAAGEAEVGHRSTSTMSDGPNQPTGTYDTLQAIGSYADANGDRLVDQTGQSIIAITSARDLRMQETSGGIAQIGHYITETAALSGPAAVQTPGSSLRQTVGSDIVIGNAATHTGGVGNSLVMESLGGGRVEIGHRSPSTNEWQVAGTTPVTRQILDGDITVEVGTDAGGVINGATVGGAAPGAAPLGDDDARIFSNGGTARIGHNHTAAAENGNQTDVSAGDIWLRVNSDLHVLGGAVGHEHYQHQTTPGTVTPETAVAGAGAIRNRIYGLTTIGAGQNSPLEDTTLLADVMKFDGSTKAVEVNSGYGGKGAADVNGQLRFFIPAQQNLTIVNPVAFNDSVGGADALPDRTADGSTIIGAASHEHNFTTMATNRAYQDSIIGAGNYGFYFEQPLSSVQPDIALLKALREGQHSAFGGGFECSMGGWLQANPQGGAFNQPNNYRVIWNAVKSRWVLVLENGSEIEINSNEMFNNGPSGHDCQHASNQPHAARWWNNAGVGGGIVAVAPGGSAQAGAPALIGSTSATAVVTTSSAPLTVVVPSAPASAGVGAAVGPGSYVPRTTASLSERLPNALGQAGGGVKVR